MKKQFWGGSTPIPTTKERSAKVENLFLGALTDFKEINQDIELEQFHITEKIIGLQAEHGELEVLKTKNNKFISKLSAFFEVE